MDGSISMLGMPKIKENYHIYNSIGFRQSGSIEDHCETMEEFNEEDIWGAVDDTEANQDGLQENGCHVVATCVSMGIKGENSNNSRRSVKIPRKESCDEDNNSRREMRYQSAPLNISDWSPMVWKEKKNENCWGSHGIVDDKSDDGDDMDFQRIPPHEFIARQLAQSKITSFSVYEGVGRTLKGRDLSRVRNAVWTRTGFIE